MKKHYAKPYKELPPGWTIVRVQYNMGKAKFYGQSMRSRTKEYDTYDEVVQAARDKPAEPWGV